MLDKPELNDELYDSDEDEYPEDEKVTTTSSVDARRRIEELQEERRLRRELEDYYSF